MRIAFIVNLSGGVKKPTRAAQEIRRLKVGHRLYPLLSVRLVPTMHGASAHLKAEHGPFVAGPIEARPLPARTAPRA
jgi:hypothetical protein